MDQKTLDKIHETIRDRSDLSVTELAKRIGRTRMQVNRILTGEAPFRSEYTSKIREYIGIGCPLDSDGHIKVSIEIVDLNSAQSLESGKDVSFELEIPEYMLPDQANADDIKLVKVPTDHCAPEYQPSEYVFVDLSQTTPEPSGLFLVWSGTGYRLQYCEYAFGSGPTEIVLTSPNKAKDYATIKVTNAQADIKGRAIGKIALPKI